MPRTALSSAIGSLGILLASCAQPATPKADAFPSAESTGTILTPHLEQGIEPGKNVLWCASFQIAWNEFMDFAGGPIVMEGQPAMADALNRRAVGRDVVDRRCLVARCGLVGDGIIDAIRADLKSTFGPDVKPRFVPKREGLKPDDVVAYAYLRQQLMFETPFQSGTMQFPTTDAEMASFGIGEYRPDDEIDARLARQVRILWYTARVDPETDARREQFIVELKPRVADERIILAKADPKKTLGATVEAVLKLADHSKTRKGISLKDVKDGKADISESADLLEGEKLRIPVLDLKLKREFKELYDRPISSPPRLFDYRISKAVQLVRFRLDEKGATVMSGVVILSIGDGPPRRFVFDQPFLLMLIRKDAAKPYLALWVGNHELMVPVEVEPHGNGDITDSLGQSSWPGKMGLFCTPQNH